MAAKKKDAGLSKDAKTIITVLLLIFLYPVGLITMWIWTDWPKWIKWLLTLLLLIPLFFLLLLPAALIVFFARDYSYQSTNKDDKWESKYEESVDYEIDSGTVPPVQK